MRNREELKHKGHNWSKKRNVARGRKISFSERDWDKDLFWIKNIDPWV